MYWEVEVTTEDEERIIRKTAETIHKYGMDVAAILMIESFKPLTFIGTQMGRFFLAPFLPVFGENVGVSGEKFLTVFEKRENVEKLISLLEEIANEKEIKKADKEESEEKKSKGWKRFLPF